jgi:hypothetical protein
MSLQPAEQTVLLDASQYETFVIDFAASIQNLRIKNISPGQLYVFVLRQDADGGHGIAWGNSCHNGAMLDQAPRAVTVQSFIGTTGGILYAIPPATWN